MITPPTTRRGTARPWHRVLKARASASTQVSWAFAALRHSHPTSRALDGASVERLSCVRGVRCVAHVAQNMTSGLALVHMDGHSEDASSITSRLGVAASRGGTAYGKAEGGRRFAMQGPHEIVVKRLA